MASRLCANRTPVSVVLGARTRISGCASHQPDFQGQCISTYCRVNAATSNIPNRNGIKNSKCLPPSVMLRVRACQTIGNYNNIHIFAYLRNRNTNDASTQIVANRQSGTSSATDKSARINSIATAFISVAPILPNPARCWACIWGRSVSPLPTPLLRQNCANLRRNWLPCYRAGVVRLAESASRCKFPTSVANPKWRLANLAKRRKTH